ncbi:valine--tRNA ligase [Anaerocolumna sedimenticola]|uniref:Valine--tRNA ligase n=1 Tax=Anaerocolumna sedimenticola TaxID=2696063 RepID=A0A6P1TRF0_9FIRM|nr:valine--tRNA ligase [Anaerocolumna sedimenticola]QHQ63514.1 valine--tRNA ligase [Anaerocolumna sedimenticola]
MDKKYDFKKAEKEMQKLWKENEIYGFQNGRTKKVFSIDTPPPTVSGNLHIGHVFSYTQAEMIARFKRMQGFDVFYPFGFDDNGLPTERLIEKSEKIHAKDLPRSEFGKKCMAVSEKYEEEFKQMWESLGFSVDWNQQYRTAAPKTQRISQRSFLELVKMKKAYRKESPVLWCTECQTSIAQAELDTKDLDSTFNYLEFKTDREALTIATTRPELLYGCVCLFVNPSDERYVSYIGETARVPLYDFTIPILADEEVSMEKGTGVVMCATFGDTADTVWFEKYKLPLKQVIKPDGKISEEVPYLGGMKVKEAREEMIRLLKEKSLLIKQEEITHTVAVHERCGKEIEIIPSSQWYIDILSDKERFLKAADEINWYPASMKTRYQLWVVNLKWDWCISRQRYFGVPFPVWYCKECGRAVFADEEELPVNPLENKPKQTCSCGCSEFIPETAVFDTWATSSVTPLINARFGEEDDRRDIILPMGMRAQAHEIIRTWAFYTIVKSLYHTNQIPWKDIMISGFVLAKKGEKISKSKNNAENSPINLIDNHSADVMRYWAANSKLGTDTFFSEEELKTSKRFITKLWNASRFVLSHLEDVDINNKPKLKPVDLWILERVKETTIKSAALLDEYEIGQARHEMDDLFWKDFCDYYIEIIKERLYQPDKHGTEARKSGQYAIYHALLGILKLYAIYTPHITDYIYQEFYREREKEISIHNLEWDGEESVNQELLTFGEELKRLIMEVRKYKSEHNMSMKDEMKLITVTCDKTYERNFKETEKDLLACTNSKEIIYKFN